MIPVTADDTRLLKDLGHFIEPVEVYDPNGKLLGLFVPANRERCKEMAKKVPPIDWAVVERRAQSKEHGVPFTEVLGWLKQLETELARRKSAGEPAFTTEEGLAYFRSLREQPTASNP